MVTEGGSELTLRDKLVGTASVLGIAASTWGPTYWLADRFGYHAALGGWTVGGLPLYWPGQLFAWSGNWAKVYPGVFAPAMAATVIGIALSAALARFGLDRSGQGKRPKEFGADTWGTLRDAKRAGLLDDRGVVLGKLDGRLLTHHGDEAVLVSGPTRSGKDRGTVIPTLLSHTGSAFILDTKEELFFGAEGDGYRFEGTSGWRATFSHVLYFNPLDKRSARFNPLFEVRKGEHEVGDAQVIAAILTDPAGVRDEPDIWDRATREFFSGLILHQLYAAPDHDKTLAGIRRQLVRPIDDLSWEMQNTLHLGDRPHPVVVRSAQALLERAKGNDRYLSSVLATADSFLSVFDNPVVEWTTEVSQWRMGDIMTGRFPVSAYLSTPASDEDVLMVLLRMMMVQFLKANMRHLDRDNRGRPKRHKCLIVANEFPALKKMRVYELLMKRFAQYGIRSFKTVQSFNDIKASYGPYNTIRENCHVTVTFASADPVTEKELSGMLGKDTEYRDSETVQGGGPGGLFGTRSVHTGEVYREIVDPGDVRELDPDHEYLLVTGFPKFKAGKVRYDREPVFRERLMPAAEVGDGLGEYPDLPGPVDVEWLGMRADCPPRPVPVDPKKPPRDAPAKADRPAAKRGRPRKDEPPADPDDGLPPSPEWADDAPSPPVDGPPSAIAFQQARSPDRPGRRRGVAVKPREQGDGE